jgi:hypothetical protein
MLSSLEKKKGRPKKAEVDYKIFYYTHCASQELVKAAALSDEKRPNHQVDQNC